mgnify:CR=1 FL=1
MYTALVLRYYCTILVSWFQSGPPTPLFLQAAVIKLCSIYHLAIGNCGHYWLTHEQVAIGSGIQGLLLSTIGLHTINKLMGSYTHICVHMCDQLTTQLAASHLFFGQTQYHSSRLGLWNLVLSQNAAVENQRVENQQDNNRRSHRTA